MPKRIPLCQGQVFGEWTVVSDPFRKAYPSGSFVWTVKAKCPCGTEVEIAESALRKNVRSRCKKCADARLVKIEILPGRKIGRWTIAAESDKIGKYRTAAIVCDCGSELVVHVSNIKKLNRHGCARCLGKVKHGMCRTPEYNTWYNMINRCYNQSNKSYKNYGGRGVSVCDRWNPFEGGSFENFYKDMGPKPGFSYHLDKEFIFSDNLLYAPGLVAWVDRKENIRRRRNCLWILLNGIKMPMTEFLENIGVDRGKFYYLVITKGLDANEVLLSLGVKVKGRLTICKEPS
jgi:hypothetical protein